MHKAIFTSDEKSFSSLFFCFIHRDIHRHGYAKITEKYVYVRLESGSCKDLKTRRQK